MRKFLLGILIGLPVLFAQPFQHQRQMLNQPTPVMRPEVMKKPGLEEFLDDLGLKSAEKKKMLDMWFKHKKAVIDMKANVKKMEIDMERLLMADKLQEQKIIEQAKNIGEAKVNERVEDLKFKFKILRLIPDKHKDEFKRFLFHPKRRLQMDRMRKMIKKGSRR